MLSYCNMSQNKAVELKWTTKSAIQLVSDSTSQCVYNQIIIYEFSLVISLWSPLHHPHSVIVSLFVGQLFDLSALVWNTSTRDG